MNPQFRIHIPRHCSPKCHVVISLTQKYDSHIKYSSSNKAVNQLHPIGFAIYDVIMSLNISIRKSRPLDFFLSIGWGSLQVPNHISRVSHIYMASNKPLDVTSLSTSRETVTFFTLPAGDFIVMPFTKSPNTDASFILRILTDEVINIV